jgi:hypothetical protein
MAASRSVNAVEAPAIGVPPAIEILVLALLGFGVDDRVTGVDFGFAFCCPSEMRYPAAVLC